MSATLFSDEIYEVLEVPQAPGAMLTHGFTYSGHPASCAAALKVLEIIERDDVCGHVRDVGPYFEKQLDGLWELSTVDDVRGSHMIHAVELVADRETGRAFDYSVDIGKRVARHAQQRGVMIRPMQHVVILAPPITVERPRSTSSSASSARASRRRPQMSSLRGCHDVVGNPWRQD